MFYIRVALSGLMAFAIAGTAAVCPSISQQPQSTTIYPCLTARFEVTASGTSPLSFQWYRDGNAVAGATNSTYSSSCYSGLQFWATVSNAWGVVTSAVANLHCLQDVVPPTLLRATVLKDLQTVVLSWYPCPLEPSIANDPQLYGINGGVLVSNATLTFGTNVLLRGSLLAPSTRYEVTVEYMMDIEGNIITEPATTSFWTPPFRLSFLPAKDRLQLTWPANAILQQSLILTGAWADISNNLNVLTVSNGPTRFFRVRFP